VAKTTDRDRLLRILADTKITGQGLRILLLLYLSIDTGAFAPITPHEIARLLNLHDSCVKRSLRTLVENGFVRRRYQTGKLVGYEIVEEE